MSVQYPNLFRPLKINGTVLKNRIVSTPLGLIDISELNGPGYVIKGSVAVDAPNSMWADLPYAFSRHAVDDTHDWIIKAHSRGMKAGVELIHCGNQARAYDEPCVYGPCEGTNDEGYPIKAMNEADMKMVAAAYGKAARDAMMLGFDIIFLHFAHGWLPAEFLSPLHNHRTDAYGGSLENRAKFPLMILEAVRKAVGPRFPIDMRISAVEHVEGSIEFEDTLSFIKMAEPYIDAVQISCGLDKGFGYNGNVTMCTTIFEPHEINVDYAAQVKQACPDLVVGVVGGIETPERAEAIIAEGKADLVALGRALLADPEWVYKAQCGNASAIRPCVRCLQCYHISTEYRNIGCTVNPRFHHHSYVPKDSEIRKNTEAKTVVIIGGGPAGIAAALAADKRGNHVILLEKEAELGGMMRYIIREHYKDDMKRYYDWLMDQAKQSSVEFRMKTEATPEMVRELKPDYLIVAVGSQPKNPPVKGLDLPHVHDCLSAIRDYDQLGDHLVIIGGGSIGSEIALGAAEIDGKTVSIVEMTDVIAGNANMLYRVSMAQHMNRCDNLTLYTGSVCNEVREDCVVVKRGDEIIEIPYDDVIVASGMAPKTDLANQFFGITPETCVIGDANSVRLIQEANLEGTMAGLRTL